MYSIVSGQQVACMGKNELSEVVLTTLLIC